MKGIEVNSITKNYKDTKALNQVSIHFEEHKIYGLLGRNGAGKSTLLNIINNRVIQDSGTISLNGSPLLENDSALRKLFLVSEKNLYPEGMKVKEVFRWTKEFYPDFDLDYAHKLAEQFQLPLKKKIKGLSTGYQSIFKNVVALSVNVPYVFLDEPVLGLDAYHRDLFYRILIEKYSEKPFTVVISTHLIEEVANLIEHVIIIKEGEIIKNESREELLQNGYTVSGPASLIDSYISGKETIGTDMLGGLKTAYIIGRPDTNLPDGLEISAMDLQKLFIQLTGMSYS